MCNQRSRALQRIAVATLALAAVDATAARAALARSDYPQISFTEGSPDCRTEFPQRASAGALGGYGAMLEPERQPLTPPPAAAPQVLAVPTSHTSNPQPHIEADPGARVSSPGTVVPAPQISGAEWERQRGVVTSELAWSEPGAAASQSAQTPAGSAPDERVEASMSRPADRQLSAPPQQRISTAPQTISRSRTPQPWWMDVLSAVLTLVILLAGYRLSKYFIAPLDGFVHSPVSMFFKRLGIGLTLAAVFLVWLGTRSGGG